MIAGGVDAPIAPLIMRGFMAMRILASRWNDRPELASRPFSRDREGFVIAEGSWFFVMEEMEQAKARGAAIPSRRPTFIMVGSWRCRRARSRGSSRARRSEARVAS